jgi:hypothetical protein
MIYDYLAIPDADIPRAVDPTFQHVVDTYASETVSMWRAVPDELLDFKPHEKVNPIRAIMVHQILSERRFFPNSSAPRNQPSPTFYPRAKSQPCRPTSTSTYGWWADGCPH